MSLAIAAYQQPVLSMPGSPSVICADLPVQQESLDSMQMVHTEGGWVLEACIIAAGIVVAGWLVADAVEDAVEDALPDCDDPHVSISYDFDDNEITVEIDCGEEEGG